MLTSQEKSLLNRLIIREKSLTELSDELKYRKPSILKQIEKLEQKGLIEKRVEKTRVGREAKFRLRPFTSFFSISPARVIHIETNEKFELPYLLLEQVKDEEFKSDLRIFLRKISKGLTRNDFIILFGSVAQERGTWKSDIDVALLSNWDRKRIKRLEGLIAEVSQQTKHQIKPKFIDFVSFKKNISFIEEIKKTGLIIFGDINEEIWGEIKRYKNI